MKKDYQVNVYDFVSVMLREWVKDGTLGVPARKGSEMVEVMPQVLVENLEGSYVVVLSLNTVRRMISCCIRVEMRELCSAYCVMLRYTTSHLLLSLIYPPSTVRKFSKHCRSCDKRVDGLDHHCRVSSNVSCLLV
ncbi:hypothetical protein BC332_28431 [Capsicum chinense]|nr:hypothetical protein BC332_28431 [Capsicum chinense]